MLVYAGIDEAGYGPMLGPLCVASSVFVLDDHDPARGAPDLWRTLDTAVCRQRRDAKGRIAVDDSKKLKGANSGKLHPLRDLEAGVLSFASAAGEPGIGTDSALFRALLPRVPDRPWYASETELPVAIDPGRLQIAGGRLTRALDAAGVRFAGLRCEAIDAGPFNESVAKTGSKAGVNFEAVGRLCERVWSAWPDDHPRILIDRQGGRTHYREELQIAFPEARIRILAESEALSRYRLDRRESLLTVTFLKDAESRHLPVALASMTAKYIRELFMLRLNRFFQEHLPEVRPTAGYVTDGRRFLDDVEVVVTRLGISRPELVRAV